VATLFAGALAFQASPIVAGAQARSPVDIDIQVRSITAFDPNARGGLVLTSAFQQFGGISAIRVGADDAQFIALSDHGWWLKGRIDYDGERPARVSDAIMAPMLEADLAHEIDNMEGLSVHRARDGATLLTLISDDNFSILQRPLLLQFASLEEA
jgi:hypothetical protein